MYGGKKYKYNAEVWVPRLTPKGNRSKMPWAWHGNAHVNTKTRRAALMRFKKTINNVWENPNPELVLWNEAVVKFDGEVAR
jgi:hypothetical protein